MPMVRQNLHIFQARLTLPSAFSLLPAVISPSAKQSSPMEEHHQAAHREGASWEPQHSQQWNKAAWEQPKQGKRGYPVSTTLLEPWQGYCWQWTWCSRHKSFLQNFARRAVRPSQSPPAPLPIGTGTPYIQLCWLQPALLQSNTTKTEPCLEILLALAEGATKPTAVPQGQPPGAHCQVVKAVSAGALSCTAISQVKIIMTLSSRALC